MATTTKEEKKVLPERKRRSPLDGARDILTVYDKDPNFRLPMGSK
jgi:hypothetical protein